MNIGNSILRAMERTGLNKTLLAERMEVTKQAVSNWTHGNNTPNIKHLGQLAAAFEMRVSEFISLGEDERPSASDQSEGASRPFPHADPTPEPSGSCGDTW